MANKRREFIPLTKELKYRTTEQRNTQHSLRTNQPNQIYQPKNKESYEQYSPQVKNGGNNAKD